MTGDEIRSAFLKFFEGKGHSIMPSSSLIPHGDPTLLLTTAGMVQFKPYFLGEETPPNPRLASCQKCFRTTDVESVGDSRHLTFFEMLGNFSIGDYFKKESIAWAWEFLTEWLKIPPEKLWITVYLDDDEAFGYWREIGIPAEKILRFGDEDNYWGPAGDSGPCGPCSEIHYDFGEDAGCGLPDCKPNCECGRFSEIWNLVFTQFNQDESGLRTPLPKPNIDTGMGLERIAAAVADRPTVYETDFFRPLLAPISELAGTDYGSDKDTDNAMRVLAEHGRAVAFLIADGVIPANEKQGYVLRRLLRRAALYGRRLGRDRPFLTGVARAAIERMGALYPELSQRQDFILKVIELEEARFAETLSTGLALIEDILARARKAKTEIISGTDAFQLYDTYGFPVELTREIVGRAGFSVDEAGFSAQMETQRQRARAGRKVKARGNGDEERLDIGQTAFVGYENLEHSSTVLKLLLEGGSVTEVTEGQEARLILDRTPFYGEMGGQLGDTGEIRGGSGRFYVTDTGRIPPDVVVHHGYLAEGTLRVGDEVQAEVETQRRADIARNHTATHLLHSALRRVLGEDVQQRGSLVAPERLRFDFSHLAAVNREELGEIGRAVNEMIRANLAVGAEETSYKQAIAGGAIALFDEKYGESVRVLKIGNPAVSTELCGGTHVSNTGEIGYFQIISEGSIGSGLRRIEAVTGREAERYMAGHLGVLESVAATLETTVDKIPEKLIHLFGEQASLKKRLQELESRAARDTAKAIWESAEVVGSVKLVTGRVPSARIETLREISDTIRDYIGSGVIVLATEGSDGPLFIAAVTADLVEKGYHAGNIIREVAKVTGGGGGGRPQMAQAGGRDNTRIDEALALVKSLVMRGGGKADKNPGA